VKTHTARYSDFPIPPTPPFPNGQVASRPILIVELYNPATKKTFRCLACADSGADHCIFPLSFAPPLGLDPPTLPMHMTGGVGNAANATHYADLEIRIPFTGQTLAFKTRVGFLQGMDAQGMGLLGQTGFFESYGVRFDYKSKLFHIDVSG
jgi:hypothetical protein